MKFLNNGVLSKNNGVMSKNNGGKSVDSLKYLPSRFWFSKLITVRYGYGLVINSVEVKLLILSIILLFLFFKYNGKNWPNIW